MNLADLFLIQSLEAEINTMKQKVKEIAAQWIETKNVMSTFMTDVKNKPIESVQLEPIIRKIDGSQGGVHFKLYPSAAN